MVSFAPLAQFFFIPFSFLVSVFSVISVVHLFFSLLVKISFTKMASDFTL